MIQCPACGTTYPKNTLYCYDCGQPLIGGPTSTLPPERGLVPFEGHLASAGRPAARDGLHAPESLDLTIRHRGRRIALSLAQDVLLGRTDSQSGAYPDLDLTPFDGLDMGVSRRHARLRRTAEAVEVLDLGSANGTFWNGVRLSPNQTQVLRDGDELRLGKLVIEVHFRAG